MKSQKSFGLAQMIVFSSAAFACFGCGGDSRISVGDVCKAISEAICDRSVECGTVTDKKSCVSDAVEGCCSELDCKTKAENDEQDNAARDFLDACVNAYDNFDCGSVEDDEVPTACSDDSALTSNVSATDLPVSSGRRLQTMFSRE